MEAVEGLPFDHFVRLHHAKLPGHSFRTPHPKTIRIQKWESMFVDAMDAMLPKTPR
jgi:hypothetical protein